MCRAPAEVISVKAFEQLAGEPIGTAIGKAGIIRLRDGRFAKVFRRPRGLFSKLRWHSSGTRFVKAAAELARRMVATVQVEEFHRVGPERREVVIYRPVDGEVLREVLRRGEDVEGLVIGFARFLAELHARGIHPRSMHWGNVLVLATGGYGLIDVTATRFRRRPVHMRARARDFRPVLAYSLEREVVLRFGVRRFVEMYLEPAELSGRARERFLGYLRRQHVELERGLQA